MITIGFSRRCATYKRAVLIFHDIGGFTYCPKDLIKDFLKYLVLWYIGEPGGYGTWGRNRAVFFSDSAAPVIRRIIKYSEVELYDDNSQLPA